METILTVAGTAPMLEDLPWLTAFRPDGQRGREVQRRVAEALAGSLDEVVAGVAPHRSLPARVTELGDRLRSAGSVDPVVSASYFALLAAVKADDVEQAADRLLALPDLLDAGRPEFLSDWGALDPSVRRLFAGALSLDPTTVLDLAAPDEDAVQAARSSAQTALAALDIALPALAAEVKELLSQIVLVAGTVNGGGRFDGATSFHAWGALFLNAEEHGSRIDMLDGLAHESGHALLYGLSLGRPFVRNPPSERHASPLRQDARPLDGIFHATYVSARMHLAHARLLAAGAEGRLDLRPEEADQAREHLNQSRTAFWNGLGVLEQHARLTPLGARLLAGTRTYMKAATAG
ncbi:aKG-HExxH-type peptide beta-hydroxylase [Rubellimicrobium arenae]|uniref:aKG-HExxH-type peptide beta-hydroxylase n=1 Tax=Rubellimicrobium arenae TaxID=2817372 RepID=UPI001B308CC8|nr:HEXXH motif-containing putative peptide modification protein [Rubellimicrobium arenae]